MAKQKRIVITDEENNKRTFKNARMAGIYLGVSAQTINAAIAFGHKIDGLYQIEEKIEYKDEEGVVLGVPDGNEKNDCRFFVEQQCKVGCKALKQLDCKGCVFYKKKK